MDAIFEEVKQESTREKVYNAVRDAILSGRLKTGQRVTEVSLARQFKVSRAIVREALQKLAHEGLVTQNSYKGTRVVELKPQHVDEILSIRVLLEGYAIQEAKKRLTEKDKRRLRAMLKELSREKENPREYARLDLELHEKIWALSGNATLYGLLNQITAPLFAMGTILRQQKERLPQQDPSDHDQLIEKLCDGTTEEAMEASRAHIMNRWSLIKENLKIYFDRKES